MRLIRFGRQGREKPGVLLDGKRRDLSAYFQDWNSTFFAESGLERLSALLKADEARSLPDGDEGLSVSPLTSLNTLARFWEVHAIRISWLSFVILGSGLTSTSYRGD